ncbi:LysM domain-containing protein [Kribbella sp. VKM Ac-2569]|uniref:LysM peptidoglycan-binding domain-containing protein n=1 Tax=Kribbella sp. VKM Ac-2569 TaxID=2512220 RepID=UPI0010F39057|nr:LysM peptidoglycan-binding domain-containing protein [Kribbella sp. VKM Ac-2569]RZT28072.1 LysM domain-containing protein [Kribbella sp. VKM Ac-2569]
MNATIRVIKGTLALAGLAGLYLLLRWITAGSISGLRTYDLDSLTVLAVGTVAWIAYGWLVLAVVLTALEQIPGAVGALAGAVAGRITTKTARALLRSGLGVAAVTPLTVGAAHATPGDTAHVSQWTQPSSTTQSTNHRATEPHSTVQLRGTDTSYRHTEPHSTVELGGTDTSYRSTEPASTVEIGNTDSTPQTPQAHTNYRATEPPSQVRLTNPTTPSRPSTPGARTAGQADGGRDGGKDLPEGGRPRVGVPDRPTAGAPTRYTNLRPSVPVRVVVRKGDSLWSIAARELGPSATADAIAARWPDWYATNRHVIGNDPDLILPGQVLRIPPAPTGDHLPPHPQEQ